MLNSEQQQAVNANDRFIFLLAGAGSGKTTVLVNRVRRLIESGVDQKEVLLISFTKKSAAQLKTRIGVDYEILATTFHGLCYQMLKTIKEINIVLEDDLIKAGFQRNELLKIGLDKQFNIKKKSEIYLKYEAYLEENQLIDFIDLENEVLKSFKTGQLNQFNLFKYVFIDEFQDTSLSQFELLGYLISNQTHVFSVGDPDQSIYAFRGASSTVIEKYIKTYHAKTYTLLNNYRSSTSVIKYSNKLIMKNKKRIKKELRGIKKDEGKVEVFFYTNDYKEVILNQVKSFYKKGYQPTDVVVLFRSHYQVSKIIYGDIGFTEINMMSIHQSKGLEFPCVIVVGLEKNQFPLLDESIEEERRLLYVAMTRAEENLVLCFPKELKKRSRFYVDLFN